MLTADPFETLFAFQRALENRLSSDWLGSATASIGTYPPINVFQQGDDLVAIVELPGVKKEELNIQAKENTLLVAGKKTIDYPEDVSIHRRERVQESMSTMLPKRADTTPTRSVLFSGPRGDRGPRRLRSLRRILASLETQASA